ncbi:hypothetical protein D3C75_333220 [compost metagenome]
MTGANQPLSPLLKSVWALLEYQHGEAELIDEDVIDDITTVFVFQLKDEKAYVTVSVSLDSVVFIKS